VQTATVNDSSSDPRPAGGHTVLTTEANAGRVALVTGGGTGIGAATALELARTGASVVICGRRVEPLASVQAAIEAHGGRCLAVPADIREPDEVEALVEAALQRFGRIDLLEP
jgi:citronellol/citronellal dehydrogenase